MPVAIAVIVAMLRIQSCVDEGSRQLLVNLFHVPPGAEWVAFDASATRGDEEVEGIVQLSPAEYDAYVASLGDPAVWRFVPFEFDEKLVAAPPTEPALRWLPGDGAFLRDGMRRDRWNFDQMKMPGGQPGVYQVKNYRSFCLGAAGPKQEMMPCTAVPPDGGPHTRVQGLLDDDDHRLFMYVD